MCGLNSAGKTTILYKWRLGEVVTTIPTIGFNVETLEFKNVRLTCLGGTKIRPLLRHFYGNDGHGTQCLIFVVDLTDHDRVGDSKRELGEIFREKELHNVPLLVYANKTDLPGAMDAFDLTERLGLNSPLPGGEREWHVQPACAISGDGLFDGLDWATRAMNNSLPPMTSLEVRVTPGDAGRWRLEGLRLSGEVVAALEADPQGMRTADLRRLLAEQAREPRPARLGLQVAGVLVDIKGEGTALSASPPLCAAARAAGADVPPTPGWALGAGWNPPWSRG